MAEVNVHPVAISRSFRVLLGNPLAETGAKVKVGDNVSDEVYCRQAIVILKQKVRTQR